MARAGEDTVHLELLVYLKINNRVYPFLHLIRLKRKHVIRKTNKQSINQLDELAEFN